MSSTLLRLVKIPESGRIVGVGTTLLKSVVSVVAEFRRVGLDPIPITGCPPLKVMYTVPY